MAADEPIEVSKPEQPWEKANLQVGGLFPIFDSDLVFGIEGANNQSINAEDTLGLDSSLTVFQIGGMYRPGESRRNQIEFSYAGYHRDGSAVLTREIEIEGITYPVGANVESVLNFDIISATYSYAFVQTERARVALGLGAYIMPLRYDLNIETTGGNTFIEGADTTLPLPVIAVRGEFLLFRSLFLNTSVDGMYAEISDFRGALVDFNIGLEYRPWKCVGFGVGYNYFYGGLEGEGSSDYPGVDFVGSVTIRYSGLLLYGKWCF
ncbi:MAG TPA: hypothetical protein VFZ59_00280 [Verrucomicrobiae bacterium]|nr:hypothetical protein [Verrucomicrobiae bacterium]